ncbi:Pao retrotransposon peptidase, partial [Ostertagia ostertagi]
MDMARRMAHNVFHGVNNVADGKKFYADSKELFRQAGMNLREYASNSSELNKLFEEEGRSMAQTQKLLGLRWNTLTDELFISLPRKPPEQTKWTKRKVLKEVASIYDPLGILSPVTLIGKLFLQSLWKYEAEMGRHASANAYCAVAYLVQRRQSSPHKVSILMAKSRLAPLHQSITIPRLELSALTIGSKLLTFLSTQLDLELRRKFLWTDSTVALRWTNTDKTVPVFVRNRVKTIRSLTSITHAELSKDMPQKTSNESAEHGCHPAISSNSTPPLNLHLDTFRFSTWNSLLKTVFLILRFFTTMSPKAASLFFGRHHAVLRARAERVLFRLAQSQNPPSPELIRQLHLFQCPKTYLWKSQGRIDNSNLHQDTITPQHVYGDDPIITITMYTNIQSSFHENVWRIRPTRTYSLRLTSAVRLGVRDLEEIRTSNADRSTICQEVGNVGCGDLVLIVVVGAAVVSTTEVGDVILPLGDDFLKSQLQMETVGT